MTFTSRFNNNEHFQGFNYNHTMPTRSTVNFNLSLRALCRASRLKEALQLLLTAHNSLVESSTYLLLLQTCISKKALSEGKKIHTHINGKVFEFTAYKRLQNNLIRMYDKCGSLVAARDVFDKMTERDVVSWNIIIAAYKRHKNPQEALTLFHQMEGTGVQPDQFTFATILPACAKIRALEQGADIHQRIMGSGIISDDVVANALVDMYAKCGSIHKAREVFDTMTQRNVVSWNSMIAGYVQNGCLDEAAELFQEMSHRNVVSWTAMIAGYAQNGFAEKALEAFKQMQLAGVKSDATTLTSILPACAQMGALELGLGIHERIIEDGFLSDFVISSALVDMYVKCASIHKAHVLFEKMSQADVVSWTAIIAGYAQNGFAEKALQTFKQMQLSGVKPDSTTFASILPACAKMGFLEQGIDIHQSIIECGFSSDVIVASALVDMYAKCGYIHKAQELFHKMTQRDVVSWTAMIAGFVQNGFIENALQAFRQMQLAGVKPNTTTFVSILPACAKMGALGLGMDIHQRIIESRLSSNSVITSALVDMYAKCGSIHKARALFDKMPQKDVTTWNAMLAGYAQNGFCKDALNLFEQMKHSETYPDCVSFACILLACSHAGLVDEGLKHFSDMRNTFCITLTIDHYTCMVDLLGRAGHLEESLNFIIKMPVKPVGFVWMSLLSACRVHKNLRLGVFTANLLFDLDSENTSTYVLLSNIYAEVGRWGDAQKVRRLMKDRGIKKPPGCSWIEDHKTVHAFCVGDRSHP